MARALVTALLAGILAMSAGAATPRRGGMVVDGLGFAYTCLNSFACDTGDALGQVLEGAYEPATDGALRPYLVSGVSIGADRVTLTYHIRPKARWNDGVTVSAADFAFTRQANATHGSPGARTLYGRIRRFFDPKTFVLELKEPFAGWQGLCSEVLPRHALAGEDLTAVWRDRIDNPKTRRPIRSARCAETRSTSPSSAPFLSGRAAEVRRIPGWRVLTWRGPSDEHLVFRIGPGGHPALKLKLVRRALAYGIDRVQIARRLNTAAIDDARVEEHLEAFDELRQLRNQSEYDALLLGPR